MSSSPYDPPRAEGERVGPSSPPQGSYAPCPGCGESNARAVTFSWWGGVLGPKLLTHVKCQSCGSTYNGKTGQSNTQGIVLYSIAVGAIVGALLIVFAGLAWVG